MVQLPALCGKMVALRTEAIDRRRHYLDLRRQAVSERCHAVPIYSNSHPVLPGSQDLRSSARHAASLNRCAVARMPHADVLFFLQRDTPLASEPAPRGWSPAGGSKSNAAPAFSRSPRCRVHVHLARTKLHVEAAPLTPGGGCSLRLPGWARHFDHTSSSAFHRHRHASPTLRNGRHMR